MDVVCLRNTFVFLVEDNLLIILLFSVQITRKFGCIIRATRNKQKSVVLWRQHDQVGWGKGYNAVLQSELQSLTGEQTGLFKNRLDNNR